MNGQSKGKENVVVDHQARSMAQRALDRQDAHEKFCEERMRRFDAFEIELKNGVARIHQQMVETEKNRTDQRIIAAREQTKIQTRQNFMWAALTFSLVLGAKYFLG